MNRRAVQAQADGLGWQPLDPALIAMADRCAQWAWGEGQREDPSRLEAEARALLRMR